MTERLPILFDRALRPEWLDFALAEYAANPDEVALRRVLRAHLAPALASPVTLQKTVLQLQRTVGPRSPLRRPVLLQALAEMKTLGPEQRVGVRLRLLCAANGFFADCAVILLRLHELGHGGVSLGQVTSRVADRYGHRGMVPARVRYVLQTLCSFGGVAHAARRWRPLPVLVDALQVSTLDPWRSPEPDRR